MEAAADVPDGVPMVEPLIDGDGHDHSPIVLEIPDTEGAACEVRALPSSHWRPLRPACCLQRWPSIHNIVFIVLRVVQQNHSGFLSAFLFNSVGELASRPQDDRTHRQRRKPRQECGSGEVVLGIGGVVLRRGSIWLWGWGRGQ